MATAGVSHVLERAQGISSTRVASDDAHSSAVSDDPCDASEREGPRATETQPAPATTVFIALATMFRGLGYQVVQNGVRLSAVHDIGAFGIAERGAAPTGDEQFAFDLVLDESAQRLSVRTRIRRMARPGPVRTLSFDEFGNEIPSEGRMGPKRLVTLEGQVRAELVLEDHVPLPDGSTRVDFHRFDSEEARLALLDEVRRLGWAVAAVPEREGRSHLARVRRIRREPLFARIVAAARRHRNTRTGEQTGRHTIAARAAARTDPAQDDRSTGRSA